MECQTDTYKSPVSFEDLLRSALRWRPDRIILGEVRGVEARTLLDSFNTGHAGSLATIHANSATKALRRFANLVMRSHQQATVEDIEAEIGEAVDFVIHIERQPGRRAVSEVVRLTGYDRRAEQFVSERIFPCLKGSRRVSRIEVVTGVLNSIVQLIVSLPKEARITTRMTSDGAGREVVCFEIVVHESDRGKLIGKGGANMRALRVLLNSAGYLSGARYRGELQGRLGRKPRSKRGLKARRLEPRRNGIMALLEITQSRQVTATIRLEEKTADQVDKYAAFIHASADDVVNHALDYVFSKDRDFQEYLKSAEAGDAVPSLRVRRTPQPAERQEKSLRLKKARA